MISYNAVKPFNPEKFRCKDGMHVLKRWVCDFQRDCSDGSDEDPEMCGRLWIRRHLVNIIEELRFDFFAIFAVFSAWIVFPID